MRFPALLAILTLLAACGFQPVYAPKGSGRIVGAPLHFMTVDEIPSRAGQILQVALEDGLHPQGDVPDSSYHLAVTLEETKQPIIIELNGRVTRYNLIHRAKFRVYDPVSGKTLHHSEARRITSYNVAPSDFSTFIGERDARERGIQELGQDILMQLSAAFEAQSSLYKPVFTDAYFVAAVLESARTSMYACGSARSRSAYSPRKNRFNHGAVTG